MLELDGRKFLDVWNFWLKVVRPESEQTREWNLIFPPHIPLLTAVYQLEYHDEMQYVNTLWPTALKDVGRILVGSDAGGSFHFFFFSLSREAIRNRDLEELTLIYPLCYMGCDAESCGFRSWPLGVDNHPFPLVQSLIAGRFISTKLIYHSR